MFTYGNHREDAADENQNAGAQQPAQTDPRKTTEGPPEQGEIPDAAANTPGTIADTPETTGGQPAEGGAEAPEMTGPAIDGETGTEEGPAGADEQQEQLTALTAQLTAKDEQLTEAQNRLLRLQADFDNFRRRNAAERQELSTFVTIDVVNRFLKVLDNFERAEAAASSAVEVQTVADGMTGIHKQFVKTLEDLGVTEIPALHEPFDPRLHEAVMRGQNPELADETIDMVFEKGYRYRDKVVRHSKVRVINNE